MSNAWNPETLRGAKLGTCVLEEPLGIGGMGAVYLARQERPHRRVAVKVLRPHLAADPAAWQIFLARFRREADATAALDHAHIVPIYEFGEEGDIAYLVMPYLADGSLAALLAQAGTLSLAQTVQYVEQAATALDYAHKHGIVHRDVKPSNLLLHPDGRLLLADFGIARPLDRNELRLPGARGSGGTSSQIDDATLTQTGAAMGTPEYMAPEQVRGEPVSPATDVYALGIVAYAMLTGRTPFAGGDTVTVLRRQIMEPPMPLRSVRSDVPARVEEVIFWALAKEPSDRPASAGAFARALREVSQGRTLGAIFGWAAGSRAPRETSRRAFSASVATSVVPSRAPMGTQPPSPASAPGRYGAAFPPDSKVAQGGQAGIGFPTSARTGAPGNTGNYPQRAMPASMADATVYDVNSPWRQAAPQWPLAAPPGNSPGRRPGLGVLLAAIAVVALVAVLVAGGISQIGAFGQGQGWWPGGFQPFTHALPTATPSPTATPTPYPTPTPPANWLAVSPDNISLGCKANKKTQTVVLRNIGPSAVGWYSDVPQFAGTDEISVSPNSGTLAGRARITIVITNKSLFIPHSGTISFIPTDNTVGQPAEVQFNTAGCY